MRPAAGSHGRVGGPGEPPRGPGRPAPGELEEVVPAGTNTQASQFEGGRNVWLDPVSEVVSLIGSKEGIAHLPLAFIDPGDVGFYTDPGYPVYNVAISFAGGIAVGLPLKEENGFLPDLFRHIGRCSSLFALFCNSRLPAILRREYRR